ncbi:MAG: prolipoprotein diacylglyceryl transferase [Elusimicrobia bacterium]|nr:prolipoprotein diacylglyceryl transferase [Elusimicrobiota bacterium]
MFPKLLDIGPIHLASYGVFVAAGYLLGILWLKRRREKMGLSEDRFWSLIYACFAGAVLGGKLMFIAINRHAYASGELGFFRDFRYGFVFYGGFIGICIAGFAWARHDGIPMLSTADYFGAVAPIGHAIGRLGCLGAGCCYGAPTRLPWGLRFTRTDSLVPDYYRGVPLHPTQLYEAAGNVLIAALLWRLIQRKEAGGLKAGVVFFSYIVLYAALRFAVECLRADDRGGVLLRMSPAQWTALILGGAAVAWLASARPLTIERPA